jgi:hypothetical protein
LHSFLGKSRLELQSILGRDPGKIFSKLQKHMKTVQTVSDILEKALTMVRKDELITIEKMEQAQANSF